MPLGFYHNPGIWFGERPSPLQSSDIPRFEEVIAEKEFDTISIAITRDGLFSFDFSKWPDYANKSVERSVQQIEIMNTYLLCFYCAVATRGLWIKDYRQPVAMMRADHSNVLGIPKPSSAGLAGGGLSDDWLRVIYRRSIAKSALNFPAHSFPEIVLNISFDIFTGLWQTEDKTVFTFADLLLGAHVAHCNLRFAEALGLAWLVTETLLDEMWRQYLQRNRQRNNKPFITRNKKNDRIEKLTGIDFTASIKIEVLSLLDEISLELYDSLTNARSARNSWIHKLGAITLEQSANAIQLAERLFRNRFGFDTTLPPYASTIFVGGGGYVDKSTPSFDVPMREVVFEKGPVHTTGLTEELRAVLGERTSGISTHGRIVRVHLREDSPAEDDETAKGVVEAHDPAFLRIDNAHRFLPGEYKFDSQREQPHIVGNGLDEAIIMVELQHTKKSQVIVLCGKHENIIQLENGLGLLKVTSTEPPGTKIRLVVRDHPCDPLELEVIEPQ